MSSKKTTNEVNSLPDRLKSIVGGERGDITRFAERMDIPYETLRQYLVGGRVPGAGFLNELAQKMDVDIHWLVTGEFRGTPTTTAENTIELDPDRHRVLNDLVHIRSFGSGDEEGADGDSRLREYLEGVEDTEKIDSLLKASTLLKAVFDRQRTALGVENEQDSQPLKIKVHEARRRVQEALAQYAAAGEASVAEEERGHIKHRIPVLGKVPAGQPGGQSWLHYDAPDVLEELVSVNDPYMIALEVQGESMFPTLFEGDKVVMSPSSSWARGDVVVVEIEENSGDYQVKRLGQQTKDIISILSDNFLHYEPKRYPAQNVHIRGKVVKVVRTPTRQVVSGDEALLHFYQSPEMHEVLDLLPQLSEAALDICMTSIRQMAKAKL